MGPAISLGAHIVQPEKTARKVSVEEYVGCGHSFARGNGVVHATASQFSNSSAARKAQYAETNRNTALLRSENPEAEVLGSKVGLNGDHMSNFSRRVHDSKAAVVDIEPAPSRQASAAIQKTISSQSLYPSGFVPYSVACHEGQLDGQLLAVTTMQYSSTTQLTRTSRQAIQASRVHFQEQPVASEHPAQTPVNIPPVQDRNHAIRTSKSSIRMSHHSTTQQPIQNDRSHALQEKFRLIEFYYAEHNVDQAHREIKEFLQHFGREFEQHPQYAERMELIKGIEREYTEIITYESQFNSKEWVLRSTEKNIKISMRTSDGTIALLLESELDVPIEIFTTVLNEVDLHKKFIPFLVFSKEVKTLGRNSKIGHVISDFPFLSRREAFFQGAGYDRLDTNDTIFVFTRSIHNRPQLQELYDYHPKPEKDSVLLNYKYLCLEYKPLTPKKGFLRFCVNVDMSLDMVPKFILEMMTKKFGVDLFESIVKISRKFKGSDWDKAIQRRPETFQFFQRIIREYFQKRGVII